MGNPRDPASKQRDYKVGKWKPDPKWNWKPGQSGNWKGRPKGSKNIKTIVRASAKRTVTVTKSGRRRKLTIMEIGMHNLEREVVQGSRNAFLDYFSIIERHSDQGEAMLSMQELTTQDQALFSYMLARAKQATKKGTKR